MSLAIVIPLLIILGTFTYFEYHHLRSAMLNNLSLIAAQAGLMVENNLRQQMLRMDFAGMQQMLDSVNESQDIRTIYLLDTSGKVIFAPQGKNVGLQLDKSQAGCQPCHRLPGPARKNSVVVSAADGSSVFRSMTPIKNSPACNSCHNPQQPLIGLLLIDISTAPLVDSLNKQLGESLAWWSATILAVLIVVNLVLNHFVLKRLKGFASAFSEMRQGVMPSPLPVQQADEIGDLASAFNAMSRQVENRQRENQALSESLHKQSIQRGELLKRLISAQEDERKRVARELHDELGRSLSGLSLHTEAMMRFFKSDPERANMQLEQVKRLIVETSNQMRRLIMALRPSVLDDLGLAAALRDYTNQLFKDTPIRHSIDANRLEERLPPEIETALYRTFQEALNNISRHANATRVDIELARDDATFTGSIGDNGQGFDPKTIQIEEESQRGLGILGMQERVEQCGGHIEIQSNPGKGTYIYITIPLKDTCHE